MIGRMRPAEVAPHAPADWLTGFSLERYRPMLRLVDDLPGSLTPNQAEQYRRQRCRILRGYLHEMNRDFERMTKAVELLIGPESPQLAAGLGPCRKSFSRELRTAHWQIAQYARGTGKVDLERLLAAFDTMRRELRRLLPHATPLAA